MVATEEIKRVSLTHCVKVLQNNSVEPEAELWVELESVMHEAVMNEDTDQETNIGKNDFDKVVQRLKLKNKEAYHFLNKAEICFQTSMYKLCKRFIHEKHISALLSETLLKQLWKRKGKREILDNHRYIHLKEWKPRLTKTLVTEMMKEDILRSGSKFQIGGVSGHIIEEHLIVLSQNEKKKKVWWSSLWTTRNSLIQNA